MFTSRAEVLQVSLGSSWFSSDCDCPLQLFLDQMLVRCGLAALRTASTTAVAHLTSHQGEESMDIPDFLNSMLLIVPMSCLCVCWECECVCESNVKCMYMMFCPSWAGQTCKF